MHIAIIVGSTRKTSQSRRFANHLVELLPTIKAETTIDVVDLADIQLPMWDEAMWVKDSPAQAQWAPISKRLGAANGFYVIVPEWDGMAPAALKNLFHHCKAGELAHKPAILAGISSGTGGAYPIAEMRMSSYKNTHICYLPEQLVIRGAAQIEYNGDESNVVIARINYCSRLLLAYAEAFEGVRSKGIIDLQRFKNGM